MISADTIDQVLENMFNQSPAQAQALVAQMSKEQPVILAYLLAMSEYEEFSAQESELFLYIGLVLWQILKQRPTGYVRVTADHLEKTEKANEDLLEKMASDSTGDFVGATLSMVESYPEPEVLRYLTEALMENKDDTLDGLEMRPENLGYAFLHLKIVMDAFLEA